MFGGEAEVIANGTDGIIINAGPNDAITLSGIDLEGVGGGLNGISFLAGGSLTLTNSSIRDFQKDGISFAPNSNATLHVVDATIGNSGQNGAYAAIYIQPSGTTTVDVLILRTEATGAAYGIVADGSATTGAINGVIRDSDISDNAQNGITATNSTATHATLMLDHTFVAGNGASGLAATGTLAGILIGNSTIFGNLSGMVSRAGGVIVSYGDNHVGGNNGTGANFASTIGTK